MFPQSSKTFDYRNPLDLNSVLSLKSLQDDKQLLPKPSAFESNKKSSKKPIVLPVTAPIQMLRGNPVIVTVPSKTVKPSF